MIDRFTSGSSSSRYFTSLSQAQTFTASKTYKITGVRLYVKRSGTYPTALVVAAITTAGEYPNDQILCSGAKLFNSLSSAIYRWEQINFSSPTTLMAGKKYAIWGYINQTNGKVYWGENSSDQYPGGQAFKQVESGQPFSLLDGIDFMFETYGDIRKFINNKNMNFSWNK